MATKLGPTGDFPEGKLNANDEGEIQIAVGHSDGNVVIDFGKPVAWIGVGPDQADQLADVIRTHAKAIREGS